MKLINKTLPRACTDTVKADDATTLSSRTSGAESCFPNLPTVTMDEFEVGNLLGFGAYSNVHSIRTKGKSLFKKVSSFETSADEQSPAQDSNEKKNYFFNNNNNNKIDCVSNNNATTSHGQKKRFVIKRLRVSELVNTPSTLAECVTDVKNEGQILASLNHRNDIVHIFGRTFFEQQRQEEDGTTTSKEQQQQNDQSNHNDPSLLAMKPESCFLVLERLDHTLSDKLSYWRKERSAYFRSIRKPIIYERAQIVLQLAEALRYIHYKRIIHRDLKPGNMGFKNGSLKLFDFEAARFLPSNKNNINNNGSMTSLLSRGASSSVENKNDDDETFHMTGMVGTVRYMSPEIGKNEFYNCKTDVYSFGLLCYEILTLHKPFYNTLAGVDPFADLKVAVDRIWCQDGDRPDIRDGSTWFQWPTPLTETLQRCWVAETSERLTMEEAQGLLQESLPLIWKRRQLLAASTRMIRKKIWN